MHTPAPLSPRLGAHGENSEVATETESSTRPTQSWLKSTCLERDGNCCVISGLCDVDQAHTYLDEAACQSMQLVITEVTRILPFSFGEFLEVEVSTLAHTLNRTDKPLSAASLACVQDFISVLLILMTRPMPSRYNSLCMLRLATLNLLLSQRYVLCVWSSNPLLYQFRELIYHKGPRQFVSCEGLLWVSSCPVHRTPPRWPG